MELHFDHFIKTAFKASGVPRRGNMGIDAANRVISRLSNDYSLGNRDEQLIEKLANLNHDDGLLLLSDRLPNKIIGKNFDNYECNILGSLSTNEAVSLFFQFGRYSNRARDMWHSYYHYNKDHLKAVELLDVLASIDIKLLKSALLGHMWGRLGEKKMEGSLIKNIFDISREHKLSLPISLVALNSPIIMHIVKDLDLETISDLFIKGLIEREDYDDFEISSVRYMLRSLGNKKAFDLYTHLVINNVIETYEGLAKHFSDAASAISAKEGHVPDKVISSIRQSIKITKEKRVELKAHHSMLWNLLRGRDNK
jgi:hypothetical protein